MKRALVLLFCILMVLRVLAASRLALFGDEAFYWMCAQRPAWAYSDHPFMTAMLVRAGTALLGDTSLGVRLCFLLGGALLPVAVFALARPIVGSRDAWLAAGVSLAVPLMGIAGAVAVPDLPLMLFAAGLALFLERATRTGRARDWLLAGACGALGLCTHYRFLLVVGGAVAYLLLTRHGRAQWRTPGPWLALPVVLAGLVPILIFNLQLDWRPLHFQASDRHASHVEPIMWLRHPAEQAAYTTPLLYLALLTALVVAVRAARAGDHRRGLLACLALVPLGTYLVLSPFSDHGHAHQHWPVVGYLPLLPLLPGVLRGWAARGTAGRVTAIAAPALGLALVLVAFVDLYTGWPGIRSLHGPFEGWSELEAETRVQLAAVAPAPAGRPALILADNYIAASQLQFRLGDAAEVYVANHPKNAEHGRALQLQLWHRDEEAFRSKAGASALVIMESTETRGADLASWRTHVASLFEECELLGRLDCRNGKRSFRFHDGRGVRGG